MRGLATLRPGLALFALVLEEELDFLAAVLEGGARAVGGVVVVVVGPATVVVAVVVVEGTVVGVGSSVSGFTTTKEVTGVTKLYFKERLVAFSVSSLCIAESVMFSFACNNSLMVK